MQSELEVIRHLANDASVRALLKIRDILADEELSDKECFYKIEAIVSLFEALGITCGERHDF